MSKQFTTRKPSGKPGFPLVLLAGVEGSGKTWAAAEATGLPDVDRAFFIEVGESMADEYGAVPGADFEIIEHDGTVGQIREAIAWASQQPAAEGKYNMLVLDSMTEVWSLLSDNAQHIANQRHRKKGRGGGGDAQITMDLWNRATDTWNGIVNQCRAFPGPVLLTARLKVVTLLDDKGQPTKHRDWKIEAQKNLGYQVQVVLQARAPRQWTLTKIATTSEALRLEPGKSITFDDFSVGKLLESMGITAQAEASTFVAPQTDESLSDEAQQAAEQRAVAERQAEQQRKAQEERKADLQAWADNLLAFEQAGEWQKIEQGMEWAKRQSDREKFLYAQGVLQRRPSPQEAQETAQQVLDAEVVTNDPA